MLLDIDDIEKKALAQPLDARYVGFVQVECANCEVQET